MLDNFHSDPKPKRESRPNSAEVSCGTYVTINESTTKVDRVFQKYISNNIGQPKPS